MAELDRSGGASLPTVAEIRSVARDVMNQMLRTDSSANGSGQARGQAREGSAPKDFVNEADVIAAKDKGGVLTIAPGSIVTPSARDAAERFHVEIRIATPGSAKTPGPEAAEGASLAPRDEGGAVAIGSDHGGWKLKETVKKHLEGQGFRVLDQGTTSEQAVDYPDFAARVGRAVSLGEASWGVFVDGAGIGGAMALGKIPGVFPATCHDAKAATNARGHNSANVLCLGSGWVDADKARAVVDAFFATGFEGGRHLRRVEKIHAIESNFTSHHGSPRSPASLREPLKRGS